MSNSDFLIILACCITYAVIAFSILGCYVAINHNKNRSKQRELDRYQIAINSQYNTEILNLLDIFIDECFREYRATVLIKDMDNYITDEKESEIVHDLATMVGDRISDNLLDKMSLFYNRNNMDDIIANKIAMTVIAYRNSREFDMANNTTTV